MSLAILDAPTILPSTLLTGEIVKETHIRLPFLRCRTVSGREQMQQIAAYSIVPAPAIRRASRLAAATAKQSSDRPLPEGALPFATAVV